MQAAMALEQSLKSLEEFSMIEMFFDYLFAAFVLLINTITIVFDTYLFSRPPLLQRFKQLPSFIQKQAVTFVILPLIASPFVPQVRLALMPIFMISLGSILFIIGAALIGGAFTKIGVIPSVRQKSNLLTTGVYALVRHPIYSGTLIAFLGVSIIFQALVSILYWPIAVLLYWNMVNAEERLLVTEYGAEYVGYQSKVKSRLLPLLL